MGREEISLSESFCIDILKIEGSQEGNDLPTIPFCCSVSIATTISSDVYHLYIQAAE